MIPIVLRTIYSLTSHWVLYSLILLHELFHVNKNNWYKLRGFLGLTLILFKFIGDILISIGYNFCHIKNNDMTSSKLVKTLQVRVKDRHAKLLRKWAFEVNQIWNFTNAYTAAAGKPKDFKVDCAQGENWSVKPVFGDWPTGYDMEKVVNPYRKSRNFVMLSATMSAVAQEHATRRQQFKKSKLRWRVSSGSKRSLGWIPFKKGNAVLKGDAIKVNGVLFKAFDIDYLKGHVLRAGNFAEDARGRWYFNAAVEYAKVVGAGKGAVGIDLGLKDCATCSDGSKLEAMKHYRKFEEKLAKAQQAGKKKLVKTIHAKIKNKRKHDLHVFSTRIAETNAVVAVGDVSSSKLAKTKMAKSVMDAGWYMLKTQLKYKVIARSGVFEEVNEKYTTQVCSSCGHIGDNSPKGRAGLGIREWVCDKCNTKHDRDVNAATNILRAISRTRKETPKIKEKILKKPSIDAVLQKVG